ncbi:hypothetical protein [Streptomyces sp. NPDC005538]|uniref:hypothetical protein n=1 Tax=unclassified Streptomyces TaxID=2593676 RepID=UPI0033A8717A
MLTVSLGALANTAPEHGAEILRTLTGTDDKHDAELAVKAAPAYLGSHYELACDTLAHAWAHDTDVSEEAAMVFHSIRDGEVEGVTREQIAEIEARLTAIDEAQ